MMIRRAVLLFVGEEEGAAAWAEGQTMTLEHAVSYALQDAPDALPRTCG